MPATKRRSLLALAAVPVVAVIVVAGVWVTGGLLSNDFRTSMALTAIWFALAGTACLLIGHRWRPLRLPVLAAFVLTAGAVGGYLAATTVRDRTVHEQVIAPVAPAQAAGRPQARGPIELATGRFHSHEHPTAGTARIVRSSAGRRFLTLTSFSTSPGPDLRVRLVPGDSFDGGADGAIDLGALKGNRGDQQYRIPSRVDVAGRTVVIWCRAFSAPFGSARLLESPRPPNADRAMA